jgi:hypothetical protein
MTSTPSIVFIGGFSRNGSTLLGRLLAESATTVCVGETQYIWRRGVRQNVDCSCGEAFSRCDFWTQVGQDAFRGWNGCNVSQMNSLEERVTRFKYMPLHHLSSVDPRFDSALSTYMERLESVYTAVSHVSGANTIVDTSKHPAFGLILARLVQKGWNVNAIHLIRDSRATAYSWTRPKKLPRPINGMDVMPTFAPARTAARWLRINLALQLLLARSVPVFRLRYETLISNPEETLTKLAQFTSQELMPPNCFLGSHRVDLRANHIFSGNPMRTKIGQTDLKLDDRWKTNFAPLQQRLVTSLTWPLLKFYGYTL